MEISRSGTQNPSRGPAEYFTGTATITRLFDPEGPSQVGAALVRFEPGARTAWHTHPLGDRSALSRYSGLRLEQRVRLINCREALDSGRNSVHPVAVEAICELAAL